jgi:hypothetical protein
LIRKRTLQSSSTQQTWTHSAIKQHPANKDAPCNQAAPRNTQQSENKQAKKQQLQASRKTSSTLQTRTHPLGERDGAQL